MPILDNNPSFRYINIRNMVVIFEDRAYSINDMYTNQKYIYWDLKTPNDLIESNIKLDQTATRFWIIMNDKGTSTIIPQDRIIISGDKAQSAFGSGDVNSGEFQSLKQQVADNKEKYNILSTDVDGMKNIIGTEEELEDGTILKEIHSIKENAKEFERTIREVQTSVKDEYKEFRNKITATLIAMTTSLSEFKADINSFSYDSEITEAEKITMEDDISKLISSYTDINTTLDGLIGILEINGETTYINRINSYNRNIDTAMNNLINITRTAISDNETNSTEMTTIIGAIANTAVKISDMKALVDEIVTLGLGGTMYEEFSKLNMYKDKIQMEVHNVAKQGDNLQDSFSKFEMDSKSISQTVSKHTETINGMTSDLSDVKDKINKTVVSVVPMYSLSDSSVQPGDTWTSVVPSYVSGKYIWSKTVTTYSDDTVSETEAINLTTSGSGSGAPGVGISKIEVWYYSSTSNVELSDGTWSTTRPENKSSRYIWTKHKIYYTDTSTMETSPLCVTGIPGNDGINPKTLRLVSSTYVVGYKVDNTPKDNAGSIELTAIQQNYTDEIVWSFTPSISATGTGNKRTILFRDLAPYNSVTATITADGLEDSVTIYKVMDGDDGYTIILSNENHTFRGGTKSAIAQSTSCDVIAYKGTQRIPCTIGEITGMPIGMTIPSHSNNGTTTARFTVEVATSMTSLNGVLNVPVTVEGVTINKTFSYTLGLKGEDAKGVYLSADRYIIPFDEGGNLKNSSVITLNAKMDNLEGTLAWSVSPSTVELTNVTSNTKTINPSVFKNIDAVEVTVSCNSYSDSLTLVKVTDGNGGYAVALTNESHIFSGNETSAEIGATTCKVMGYKGEVRKNCYVGEIKNIPVGMEVSITNNNSIEPILSISVDNTMTTSNGELDIPITIGDTTFNKTFSYSIGYIGKTGVGIKNVDVEYILTDSPDIPPSSKDSGWQTTPPTWEMNKFIWSRTKTYYTNNNVVTTLPVMISGNPGEDAKALRLKASRYVIVYDKNGEVKDNNDIIVNTVLENFDDTVVWTTSPEITLTGDNLQKTIPANVFDNHNQIKITASASTLSDTLTIVKVVDGMDGEPGTDGFSGYTVMLSNENHTFLGNEKNALAGEITIDVIAYCGAERINTNIASITGCPTGMTTEILNNGTGKTQIKIKVTTALTTKNGTIKIPIVADGKTFNKVFSYSVAIKGLDSKILSLTTNKNVVSFDANDNPKDTEDIVFTLNSQNLIGKVSWSVSPSNVSLTSISTTKKKIPTTALINNDSIKVTVSSEEDNISDIVTVVKVRDGARGTSINILNEYATEEELNEAHPTGNINDAYLVNGYLYVWTESKWTNVGLFKGKDGADGTSYYIHIKYSDDGESFTLNDGEDVGAYIGILTDTNKADSRVFSDYTWKKIEGEQGLNGEDAYTVILSNESHAFAGNTNYAIAGETSCVVNGYKGGTKVKCTIGKITGIPTGMTVTISNNNTTDATFIVKVDDTMSTANGTLEIPVTIDGKVITKTFSYAIAFKGADSQTLDLYADKYVVPFKEDNTLKDTSVITLKAYPKNLNGTVTWSTTPSISLGGSGNTRTIDPNIFKNNNSIVVSATLGGYNDKVTIVKIKDGSKGASGTNGTNGVNGDDAITIVLSNPSHTFMGDETKAKASSTTCKVIAYKGTQAIACKIGTITGMPTGMSITNNGTHYNNNTTGAYFKVAVTTEMTTGNGTLTVPVTCDGKSFNLMFSYSLALKGQYGTGVVSIIEEYARNKDKTTAPTSEWSTNPPVWEEGYYLWTRSKITYKNPTKIEYTTPICDASWEALESLEIGGKNELRYTDFSKDNDPESENYILNNFSASNGGTVGLTTYTFGKQLAEDEFIRNKRILRNRLDVEKAIANNQTYSMTTWVENVTLIPNTTYTLSMYMYRGGASTGKGFFQVFPILADGSVGTRVCKSDELTTYEGKFVKLVKTFNTGGQSTKFSVRFYNYYDTTKTTGNSDIAIYHPMLERGNKSTAWSPASEDLEERIKTTGDVVANHTVELESITGRVSSVETTTSKLNNNYKSMTERVKNAEQKLTKDGITGIVEDYYTTKTQFDKLSIGSKNLLRYSDFSEDVLDKYTTSYGGEHSIHTYAWGTGRPQDEFIKGQKVLRVAQHIQTALNNGYTYCRTSLKENVVLKPNTEYTMSVYISKSNVCAKTFFTIYPVLADGSLGTKVCKSDELTVDDISSTFIKLTKTFTTGTESNTYTVRYYNYYRTDLVSNDTSTIMYIYNPMLSEGNKEIPWTPAPEDQQEIVTSTIKHMSKIEQKADSITSTVSSMKIGGGNLLRRTDFDEARGGNIDTVAEWHHWGDITVYNYWSPGNPTGQLCLYFPNEGTSGGIYQDISVGKIPKGTELVISYDLSIQKNVDKTYMAVEYLNSSDEKVAGQVFVDSSGNPQYGYQYHVFTTPTDIDYNRVRIVLASHGNKSGSNGEYIVITLKNLMLEKGNTPTSWQKSYYDNETAISEVKQTAESVTYKFENSSQANLLPHSGVSSKNTAGWSTSGDCWWYTGHSRYLGLQTNNTSEQYAVSPSYFLGNNGGWYSIHGWINAESNTNGADVFIIGSNSETNKWQYDFTHHCCGVGSNSGWYHFYATFNVPSDIRQIWVRVDNNGRKDTSTGSFTVVFFGEFMLVRGKDNYPLYTDSTEGLYAGVTSIDKNGVHVKHDDGSSTNLNAKALNFYDTSNTLYAQVNGGLYKFWHGSNYIGYLGHAKWAGTENRVVGMNSEYGQMSTLASKKGSSDNFFQVYLIANGCDQTINGVRYRQGATLIQPHIGTRLYFYTNGYYTDNYPSFIVNNADGHLLFAGDNGINIGALRGNDYYDAIRVTEIDASPYVKIDMWGNVDMHYWNLYNAQISKSVSATSAQTYALRTLSDEESYSDPTSSTITDTYGIQSLTNGDVRWSDKQTYFTSEVEEGIYEAYVEIPWWLAQNIELDYHVNITPVNGFYQYYVSERDPYYFIVRSDKDSMGFTFELVATLLEQNTLNNNASIAGSQYLGAETDDGEQPDISFPEMNENIYSEDIIQGDNENNSIDYADEISRDIEPIPHEENISND